MLQEFFAKNMDYLSAEIKGVKTERAARAGYGDDAIGYVQLKRDGSKCILKARICPEHKVRSQDYHINSMIDEENDIILSCQCEDCAASKGGCKHAVAFLFWLLRRNDEKSPTSVECYWNKPKLSQVGASMKYIKAKDLGTEQSGDSFDPMNTEGFLQDVVNIAKDIKGETLLMKYFIQPSDMKKLSLQHLVHDYLLNAATHTADGFIQFCQDNMKKIAYDKAPLETKKQSKCALWYELRYARITASKLFEISRQTSMGSLVESMLGASNVLTSEAIQRGLKLEDAVLDVVAKKRNIHIERSGLFVSAEYPLLGASPDGINKEFVIEVKCPSKKDTVKNYIKQNGNIQTKFMCQLQLQMLLCNRQKGLFCVASPKFEEDSEVTIFELDLNISSHSQHPLLTLKVLLTLKALWQPIALLKLKALLELKEDVEYGCMFIKVIIESAEEFWKKNVFPIILNKNN